MITSGNQKGEHDYDYLIIYQFSFYNALYKLATFCNPHKLNCFFSESEFRTKTFENGFKKLISFQR